MRVDKSETYRSVWSYLMTTPFKQSYVEAGGLKTRYVEAGSPQTPVIIMLHGTGGHWEAFSANIPVLAEHFHVFAIDMLGCGFTDKPDKPYEIKDYVAHIVAFMDVMDVSKTSFIGVSLGAWICAQLALDIPTRVERMILVAPSGIFPVQASSQASLDQRRATADDPSWNNAKTVLAKLFYDPDKVMDDLVAVRQRVYGLPGMDRIMPRMLTLFDPEIRTRNNLSEDQWKSIQHPILIIENVDTDDIFLKAARKIVTLLPNARLVPIKECSHWAQFESPADFNRVALEFLSPGPA